MQVSIGRLRRLVESKAFEHAFDVTVLFMALRMLNCTNAETESSSYTDVKTGVEVCNSRGIATLNVLAATIILAQFEMAHAIYPQAYMTVCICSRFSHLLGLHDSVRAVQVLPNPGMV